MYQKTILPSGLRVVTVPMPQVKSVTALVMVAAGSRYESQRINGLSHFLEHMIFKGTKRRPSSLAISSLIDGIGGQFNAFTSKEYTGFYVKAESRHLNLILDVLSDMLLNSLYDPKELDKERGVIIEEINMYEDQPQARVSELFEELLYGKQPLAWRISGEKKNIREITHKDMTDYVRKMYHSKAMVIGLAGNIENNNINKYFGNIFSGEENKYLPVAEKQTKSKSLIYYKKTDQAHLCLGVRAYDLNHPDRYALAVLGTILGGNMSSRLFIEVREKRGLAYYVHADSEEFHDCGYFVTQAGLRLADISDAIKVILNEFNKMKNNLVPEKELRRAKDHARGRMVLGLEDSYRTASFYASQELLRKEIETPEEVLAKIEAVTAEDIQRVAKDIFVNQKLNLAIVGPFKKAWKELSF
ncbi:insulinase family protein [Candidatus Gottesmanbacteria bacterium]|nr:insulinase family protein [Candidatus Gottesmanbacteria bacterium]